MLSGFSFLPTAARARHATQFGHALLDVRSWNEECREHGLSALFRGHMDVLAGKGMAHDSEFMIEYPGQGIPGVQGRRPWLPTGVEDP